MTDNILYNIFNIKNIKNKIHIYKSFNETFLNYDIKKLIELYDDKYKEITDKYDDIAQINIKCGLNFFNNADPVLQQFCRNIFKEHRSNVDKYNELIQSLDQTEDILKRKYVEFENKSILVKIEKAIEISSKQLYDVQNCMKSENSSLGYARIQCTNTDNTELCTNIRELLNLMPEVARISTFDNYLYNIIKIKAEKSFPRGVSILHERSSSNGYRCHNLISLFNYKNVNNSFGVAKKFNENNLDNKYLLTKALKPFTEIEDGFVLKINEDGRD